MKTITLTTALTLISSMLFCQPKTFTFKTNNQTEIILLSEGQREGKPNNLIDASAKQLSETMPNGTYTSATNAFLVRTTNGKNILVDAGYGSELFNNIKSLGITADSIHAILITHMHGDNIGGLLDKDGKKTFPNAKLYLPSQEYTHYVDRSSSLNDNARKAGMAVIQAYGEQKLVLFQPEKGMVEDCVKPIYAIGHTPGHTVYQIDNMLIWGDLTHVMDIQMPYPNVAITYDTDSKLAVSSRLKMLKYIVDNNLNIAGMHIAYPGMGTIKTNGKSGYIFTPLK
ncbi:MAG: MBL fold metallo-hydrolase [Bacteroidales bacterium]|jgi:glyoxylase-like metal-dependent hydrolase (beta-lactamase superfamily II)|nr:MBL fold metallo-hydrolase [Bacteroidales bacterium]